MTKLKNSFLCSLIAIVFLSAVIVLCRTTYQVSRYNACPPQDSTLHTLVDRSIEQCVEECTRRKSCAVVGYKSLVRLCELHAKSSSPDIADNRCILITREDMRGPECDCAEGKTCDADNGPCVVKECRPLPPLDNGTIYGNMNHMGAKKMVKCATGFFEINNVNRRSIQCSNLGNWRFEPRCQECPGTGEMIKFPRSSSHKGFKIYTNKTTQEKASGICARQTAHLVRINKWWKIRYTRSILDNCVDANGNYNKKYWTDGKRDGNGNWTYSDGKNISLDYTNWYKIRGNGNCAGMRYKLFDIPCERNLRYICELD